MFFTQDMVSAHTELNIENLFSSRLFRSSVLILFLATFIPTSVLANCWRYSREAGSISACSGSDICIEWEEDGLVTASACCAPSPTGNLKDVVGCYDTCDSEYLARPLAGVPSPTTVLPKARITSFYDDLPIRPQLDVVYQGEEIAPEHMGRLDGKTLHFLFVLNDGNSGKSALYAFDDRQELTLAVATLQASGPFSKEEGPAGVLLFEDPMWKEATYFLPEGFVVNFFDSWWAERISSLRGSGPNTWITLFTGPDQTGSSLTLATGWDRPTLETFGWNDRTVSAYVWSRESLEGPGGLRRAFP